MAKKDRGFASMGIIKQQEIASKGGKAAHAKGGAHEWDSEEARAAGRNGGKASNSQPRRQFFKHESTVDQQKLIRLFRRVESGPALERAGEAWVPATADGLDLKKITKAQAEDLLAVLEHRVMAEVKRRLVADPVF